MRVKVKAFKDTWVLKGDAYLPDMAKFEDLGMHTYRDFAPELGQLLKAQMPKAGSYEFVTCAGEEWLRLTLISTGEFGQVGGHCGHAMLADEQPVLFAGQVLVSSTGTLEQWCNASGTYDPPIELAGRARLPMAKFSFCCGNLPEQKELPQELPFQCGKQPSMRKRVLPLHSAEEVQVCKTASNNMRSAAKRLKNMDSQSSQDDAEMLVGLLSAPPFPKTTAAEQDTVNS